MRLSESVLRETLCLLENAWRRAVTCSRLFHKHLEYHFQVTLMQRRERVKQCVHHKSADVNIQLFKSWLSKDALDRSTSHLTLVSREFVMYDLALHFMAPYVWSCTQ